MIKRSLRTILLSVLLCLAVILGGCSASSQENEETTEDNTNNTQLCDFTVTVKSHGGMPLEDIGVYIYADEAKEDLVWAAHTDKEGKTVFSATMGNGYFLYLDEIPKGYTCDPFYKIEEAENLISLKAQLLDAESIQNTVFKPGDVFFDFEITAFDGTTYKLSELLETKKAVALNFWYHNCQPCMMEFPYLQEAYAECSDSIEIIGINYTDGTNESLSAFAEDKGITLPLATGERAWASIFNNTASPTTVIIDRFGTVAMIHTGAVTEAQTLIDLFDFFTADSYTQTTVRNLSDIK